MSETPKAASEQNATPTAAVPGVVRSEIDKDEFLDMQELDPKTVRPDRHYRLVRADDKAIAKARRRGYDLEHYKDGGVQPLVKQATGGDTIIRFQDRVLMSCPRDRHESRQRAKLKRTAERLSSTSKVVKEKAAAQGVKVITDRE